jgi:hypothetical protein
MTSASGDSESSRWLVTPPGSNDIHFEITAGDQVQVTPEIQQAFENLVQALRGDDMQGYVYDPKCTTKNVNCEPNYKCTVETQKPCFIDYHCQISRVS